MTTCWTQLNVADIDAAANCLGVREYAKANKKWIAEKVGIWDGNHKIARGREADVIAQWAIPLGLAGVVWTDLPCKFSDIEGKVPTGDEVVSHLSNLKGTERQLAEEYIRKAPQQIDTAYRRQIEQELGWTILNGSP